MKMKTMITAIMLMISMMSFANGEQDFVGDKLELEVGYIEPFGNPHPRTPEIVPTIYFDGSTLFFATPCDGCTLQITDKMGNICYQTVIPTGTTTLTLPQPLVGEYLLKIIDGNTCYYGNIYM